MHIILHRSGHSQSVTVPNGRVYVIVLWWSKCACLAHARKPPSFARRRSCRWHLAREEITHLWRDMPCRRSAIGSFTFPLLVLLETKVEHEHWCLSKELLSVDFARSSMNYTIESFRTFPFPLCVSLSLSCSLSSLALSLIRRVWNNKHDDACVWSSSFHPPAGTRSCSGARRKRS